MAKAAPVQQLLGYNTSARIGESLAARIKDPLWFLVRQWQTGEFEAENGGRPAVISITSREIPINRLTRNGASEDVPPETPLEFAVEREANDGSSPVWNSESLESGFEMSGGGGTLVAREYTGRHLDWFHFDLKSDLAGGTAPTIETRVVAGTLPIRGAPDPRWWRFEEGDAYYDDPKDPEPNILSTLLPEFALIDVNNWFIAPLLQTAGTVREIRDLSVVDSFGVTTSVGPVKAGTEWAMFTHATAGGGARLAASSSSFLYVPNVAIEVLDNDEIEEVVFTRDEDANLVWACERLASVEEKDHPGVFVQRRHGDGRGLTANLPSPDPSGFRLTSEVPEYWIPYVPRVKRADGSIHLRRGRTIESSAPGNRQFASVIVGESWKLEEAGIPRTGIRVRRIHRFARGSDGRGYFWVGRDKSTAPRIASPELKFDFLE